MKSLFRGNFALVHNDKHLEPKEARHVFANLVKNYANKWINNKIENPKAKQWMKDMLEAEKKVVKLWEQYLPKAQEVQ